MQIINIKCTTNTTVRMHACCYRLYNQREDITRDFQTIVCSDLINTSLTSQREDYLYSTDSKCYYLQRY